MSHYLNPQMVCNSFERLSSRNHSGKTHLERTSALLYFLAIDATFKHFGTDLLNFSPDSFEGKNNRKQMELEFARLVLVENSSIGNKTKQVTELGKIDSSANSPEKRVSSNFLTVPLKKASEQLLPFSYPKRPAAPILKMGPAATGIKWGIAYHDDWMSNLLVLFTEIKSSTPLLDLAIFACRNSCFDADSRDLIPALSKQLKIQFSEKLANFWIARIDKEKLLASIIENPFQINYVPMLDVFVVPPRPEKQYSQMNKSELISRINQLEAILNSTETMIN